MLTRKKKEVDASVQASTSSIFWQARRDSNPQHAVLETAALPLELLAYGVGFVRLQD